MEIEGKSHNAALNRAVAVTVVAVAVFVAITKVKDDNIVTTMQLSKADAVDLWNEYQSGRIKLHIDDNQLREMNVGPSAGRDSAAFVSETDRLRANVAKYTNQSAELMRKAQSKEKDYESLHGRHEQFGLSDAFFSIALALAAVAALTELSLLLSVAWAFAAIGLATALAGFGILAIHLGAVASLLG